MNTKLAANPGLLKKLKQLLGSAGQGMGNMVRSTVANNPNAAASARGLVDDMYSVYNPKSREVLKSLVGDRLNAVNKSNFVNNLPDRFKEYANTIAGGEAAHLGDRLDKGLQSFNQNAYDKIKSMLTPQQQLARVKKGFVKKAMTAGFNLQEAEYIFEKHANAVNVNKAVADYIRGTAGRKALSYAGRGALGGGGAGAILGALNPYETMNEETGEMEQASRLKGALSGAMRLGTAGAIGAGAYGGAKGMIEQIKNVNKAMRHGAEHFYENEILKKAPQRPMNPFAKERAEEAARAARNAERKAKNMAGRPIDI